MAKTKKPLLDVEKIRKRVVGKKIKKFDITTIELENGDCFDWSMAGSQSADGRWHEWLNVYFNGHRIAHL